MITITTIFQPLSTYPLQLLLHPDQPTYHLYRPLLTSTSNYLSTYLPSIPTFLITSTYLPTDPPWLHPHLPSPHRCLINLTTAAYLPTYSPSPPKPKYIAATVTVPSSPPTYTTTYSPSPPTSKFFAPAAAIYFHHSYLPFPHHRYNATTTH